MVNNCMKKIYSQRFKFHLLPYNYPNQLDVQVAGGYFTQYNNNKFCHEFVDFYEYFKHTKDVDIFYTNRNHSIQCFI